LDGNINKKSGPENSPEDEFEATPEACEACGGELTADKVNLEEFENGKLYLMENVMAYVCQQCGEVWVPEPVIKEFEKMMDTAKKHSAEQNRPVKPAAAGKKIASKKRTGKK